MPFKKIMCVYQIVNLVSGKIYIGSTINFKARRCSHKFRLRKNIHWSEELQSDWNNQGEHSFDFCIVELVKESDLLKNREQHYIDLYQSFIPENGYNKCQKSTGWSGMKHTEETKLKLSKIRTGVKVSKETRAKMRYPRGPMPEYERVRRVGECNSNAKLSERDVITIKHRLSAGEKITSISKEYAVTYQTIWEINKGKKWPHIVI